MLCGTFKSNITIDIVQGENMKFLHISDLHIGKRVNEFSMIEDQKYILRQIKKIALEQQVDAVMIAGDIYDKPVPSAEAVQLFDKFLTELADCGKKVFAVSGNHDSAERIAFGAQLMSSREVYVSPVYDGECPVPDPAPGSLIPTSDGAFLRSNGSGRRNTAIAVTQNGSNLYLAASVYTSCGCAPCVEKCDRGDIYWEK